MSEQPSLFADGILDASVNFGVARLTLAQTKADGTPGACGQLVIPVVQLPAFANGILTLLKQIEAKVKQAQQTAAATEQPPAAPEAMPSAFRFTAG
jgi:hypothetical protein